MGRSIFIVLGAVLIASNLPNTSTAAVSGVDVDMRNVSTTLNQFAADFYKATSEENPENLICSPVSISMVLSMAAFGAGGETAKEMRSALHLPADDAVTKSGFASLIDTLNNVKKVTLQLANKIFTASGFEVKSTFKDVTTNSFKSAAQSLDFGNTEGSSATINAWCSAQTQGAIEEVIKPDDLAEAAMVLINAVYFKGQWAKKFSKNLTSLEPFHINEQTTRNVSMMRRRDEYNYGILPELDARFVELPYEHKDEKDTISMFIILPNTVGGLKNVENNLKNLSFQLLHDNAKMGKVNLHLPRFRAQSTLDLQPTLEKMGMRRMFSSSADFTGIADSPPLEISKVLQKALIEVNEEGSKAAAVSVGIFLGRSARISPRVIHFVVDRPFAYVIVHKGTNTILFQGHITEPAY